MFDETRLELGTSTASVKMLRFSSQTLMSAVDTALPHAVTPEDLAALQQCKSMGSVTLTDVQLVSRLLRAHPAESICGCWVHELLRGATPLLPERAAKPPPHPDLGPRLERLRAVQADRDYARMIRGSKADPDSIGRDAAEMNTYRSQLAVGANLIVSMGTSFIVGAWCGGTEKEPYGVRAVLSGTALMIITLGIEITLFLIGAIRVDKVVDERERKSKRGVMDRTKLKTYVPVTKKT
jgi:hypothetical protein